MYQATCDSFFLCRPRSGSLSLVSPFLFLSLLLSHSISKCIMPLLLLLLLLPLLLLLLLLRRFPLNAENEDTRAFKGDCVSGSGWSSPSSSSTTEHWRNNALLNCNRPREGMAWQMLNDEADVLLKKSCSTATTAVAPAAIMAAGRLLSPPLLLRPPLPSRP